MKKIIQKITVGLAIFSFPFTVLAYSDKVILGGQNIGITINMQGVLVVGFYKVNGEYNSSHLLSGDYITKVNNIPVNNIKELVNEINNNAKDDSVSLTYICNKKDYTNN